MKITFAGIPAYGHLFPLMPLALAARAAGHDVHLATGDPFLEALPLPTDNCFPRGLTLQVVEREVLEHGFDRTNPLGFPLVLFGEVAAAHARTGLRVLWEGQPPDLVVHESLNVGASLAAGDFGIPALALSISMDSSLTRPLYAAVGLAEPRTIDPVPAGWQGTGLPTRRVPMRSVAWSNASADPPSWLHEPGDPIAYLTLGTVSFGAVEVLRRSILETAERGFRVLVAVGADGDPRLLGALPPAAHVERFIDQAAVLPLVDVAVHHGGTGTVLACLASGVPQVITPQGADQFVNAARLAELGLGGFVPNDSSDGALGAALSRVVADDAISAAVRAMALEIDAMPSPDEVATQLPSFG